MIKEPLAYIGNLVGASRNAISLESKCGQVQSEWPALKKALNVAENLGESFSDRK